MPNSRGSKVVRELRDRGFPASKKRVERPMRENGIRARHKRRYKVTTDSKHNLPIAPNLLDRNFNAVAPNQVWTSDITYLWTGEGWLYLAIVLDLFNREVVGWSLKPRMTADIVTDAMAWFRKKPAAGLMHHSDRGSQINRVVAYLLQTHNPVSRPCRLLVYTLTSWLLFQGGQL